MCLGWLSPHPQLVPTLLLMLFLFISCRYGLGFSTDVEIVAASRFGRLMNVLGKEPSDLVAEDFGIPLSIHGQFNLLVRLNGRHRIIQPLNAFFQRFFAGEDSITKAQWDQALPTDLERRQMRKLIVFLFHLNDFRLISSNHSFLPHFVPLLAKSIQLTFIEDRFCVVHERLPLSPSGHFNRSWGYLVLRSPVHCARPNLHHSAPHFQSDGDVCNQAAAIFERTSSRSLLIAGASRFAVRGKFYSPCQPKYALADAAHSSQTMFFTMFSALLEATRLVDGATNDSTTFIQWHGMAETSCANSSAFLSIGAKGTHPIYAEQNATVNKLVRQVNELAGQKVASTPAEDRTCKLVATENVLGRLVNGVPPGQCCRMPSKQNNVKGHFIHIEQKREMRDKISGQIQSPKRSTQFHYDSFGYFVDD